MRAMYDRGRSTFPHFGGSVYDGRGCSTPELPNDIVTSFVLLYIYILIFIIYIQGSPSRLSWLDIPAASEVEKGEHVPLTRTGTHELHSTVFGAIVRASHTWYCMRSEYICVLDCCVGRINFSCAVVVRPPAAMDQLHTYPMSIGTKAGA